MYSVTSLNLSPALFAIFAVILMGIAVIWANPKRLVNCVFFSFALHVTAWLFCVHVAVTNAISPDWVRLACATGAFIPAHLWCLKEASISRSVGVTWQTRRRFFWWLLAGVILAVVCVTPEFILPLSEAGGAPKFGSGYFAYMGGVLALYGLLCRETLLQMRAQSGLVRLELQLMLLGGCATAGTIIFLMALHALAGVLWPIQLQPVIVMLFYGAMAIVIIAHRIFDARQILRLVLNKSVLIVLVTLAAMAIDWCARAIVPPPLDLFVTVGIVLWIAGAANRWLDKFFHFYPQAMDARAATFAVARREARFEKLEAAFLSIVKGWGQSDHAVVLWGTKEMLRGSGIELAGDSVVLQAMRNLRWVTPERLAREKTTADRVEIARFLNTHGLGALVIGEGPSLTALVGVGAPASRRPFTYPQVTQLLELVSIIESAFERAHFSVKAQHAEQLATVGLLGASLAHEIRNPLVSIKTFVQLLPNHHQDPAFRAKFFRLISDEVTRIDQLTEQLLDLASPRMYSADMIDLHPVLRASLDLVEAKAMHRNVQLLTNFQADPDRAYTDASAAKQVMLNLCFNAIQAVESRESDRWIRISTRNTHEGLEMAVEDNGPGISPEIRPRLFQPFQTTKSTGFGLGLAICSDILSNLNATISVDPPSPGCGAAFRVTFPCQPLSS